MLRLLAAALVILSVAASLPKAWQGAEEVRIPRSGGGEPQPAVFYVPPGAEPRSEGPAAPLLVALHTWSGDYRQETGAAYLAECQRRRWVLVHPDFRGPNVRPEACGSEQAVEDVLDAVAFARRQAKVDDSRIYLVGASGGGYMALVMAHRAPWLWAGVSSWVPIADLARWHRQSKEADPPRKYYRDLEAVFGGPPDTDERQAAYRQRSPLFHLSAARGVPIDLNAGIHDGHTGSVPIDHTLDAFNVLAAANGRPEARIPQERIEQMVREQAVPSELAGIPEEDPARTHAILYQRTAGPARVTLFEGGHEIEVRAALDWLERQRKRSAERLSAISDQQSATEDRG
jgi:poly(3-hydroxybutyrate) depolymerase